MTPEQDIFTQNLIYEMAKSLNIKDLLTFSQTSKTIHNRVHLNNLWKLKIDHYLGIFASNQIQKNTTSEDNNFAKFKKQLKKHSLISQQFILAFAENNVEKIEKLVIQKNTSDLIRNITYANNLEDHEEFLTYHPLIWAIIYNNDALIEKFENNLRAQHSRDVFAHALGNVFAHALRMAIYKSHSIILEKLLLNPLFNLDINEPVIGSDPIVKYPPILFAASQNNFPMIELLHKHGAQLNSIMEKTNNYWYGIYDSNTIFHFLADCGSLDTLKQTKELYQKQYDAKPENSNMLPLDDFLRLKNGASQSLAYLTLRNRSYSRSSKKCTEQLSLFLEVAQKHTLDFQEPDYFQYITAFIDRAFEAQKPLDVSNFLNFLIENLSNPDQLLNLLNYIQENISGCSKLEETLINKLEKQHNKKLSFKQTHHADYKKLVTEKKRYQLIIKLAEHELQDLSENFADTQRKISDTVSFIEDGIKSKVSSLSNFVSTHAQKLKLPTVGKKSTESDSSKQGFSNPLSTTAHLLKRNTETKKTDNNENYSPHLGNN